MQIQSFPSHSKRPLLFGTNYDEMLQDALKKAHDTAPNVIAATSEARRAYAASRQQPRNPATADRFERAKQAVQNSTRELQQHLNYLGCLIKQQSSSKESSHQENFSTHFFTPQEFQDAQKRLPTFDLDLTNSDLWQRRILNNLLNLDAIEEEQPKKKQKQ